jgi:transcription antitermination factor NusG
MIKKKEKPQMTGNLAKVYRALNPTQIGVGTIIGYGDANPINAEARPGTIAAWHVVETFPSHERIAASHLIGRRFGVYVPETERMEVRRGCKAKVVRPMFPGYLFVFTWDIKSHVARIMACPGVWKLMLVGDHIATLSDELIDKIRIVENKQRPLTMRLEDIGRPQKGWRRKPKTHEQPISCDEIVGVRSWSAFTDGLRVAVDGAERNQILRKALGFSS